LGSAWDGPFLQQKGKENRPFVRWFFCYFFFLLVPILVIIPIHYILNSSVHCAIRLPILDLHTRHVLGLGTVHWCMVTGYIPSADMVSISAPD
jgi:hypothetical protein